jgi:DNA (cytosine-5)-methyltransferase 1
VEDVESWKREPPPAPPASSIIEWEAEHDWKLVANAPPEARARMERARAAHGPRCLSQHVTGHPGVSLAEPIRTLTTKVQWVLVDGARYRYLTGRELARGQGFPESFRWPDSMPANMVAKGIGNAVPPPMARRVVQDVREALAA